MPDYKVAILDQHGSVAMIDAFEARNDRDAWDRAAHWTRGGDRIELWRNGTRIDAES